jgi:hypothetical protein
MRNIVATLSRHWRRSRPVNTDQNVLRIGSINICENPFVDCSLCMRVGMLIILDWACLSINYVWSEPVLFFPKVSLSKTEYSYFNLEDGYWQSTVLVSPFFAISLTVTQNIVGEENLMDVKSTPLEIINQWVLCIMQVNDNFLCALECDRGNTGSLN